MLKKSIVFGLFLGSLLLSACGSTATQVTAPVSTQVVPATEVAAMPTATEMQSATEIAPVEDMGMALPEVDPGAVSGEIYTAGSSTVGPLTEAMIEQFILEGFTGQVKNDIIGSGAGFKRFCGTGETDISNASRKIKDSEIESCSQLSPSRTPIEFRVGTDAIAVVVSKENTFAKDITEEELAMLFTTAEKWSDVRTDWPAESILRYTPGTDSGTFDFFVEVVVQAPQKIETLEAAKEIVLNATNLQTSEDDNVLVKGIEGSPYAIGYFGYAYYKEEAANLTSLSVNGITPSEETAESGEYILSRPLFIYSDAEIMKAKPQVAAFINFYLTNVNDYILEVGYFPASQKALDQSKQNWLDAMK